MANSIGQATDGNVSDASEKEQNATPPPQNHRRRLEPTSSSAESESGRSTGGSEQKRANFLRPMPPPTADTDEHQHASDPRRLIPMHDAPVQTEAGEAGTSLLTARHTTRAPDVAAAQASATTPTTLTPPPTMASAAQANDNGLAIRARAAQPEAAVIQTKPSHSQTNPATASATAPMSHTATSMVTTAPAPAPMYLATQTQSCDSGALSTQSMPSAQVKAISSIKLHKRRISESPEKFNNGQFEPPTVRTDLAMSYGAHPSPAKRLKTHEAESVQVHADENECLQVPSSSGNMMLHPGQGTSSKLPTSSKSQAISPATPSSMAPRACSAPPYGKSDQFALDLANGMMGKTGKVFGLLEKFIDDEALCLALVSCLELPSLISWYAIDQRFHYHFNKHATAFVLSSMRTWAPHADKLFPWRCYPHLTIKDPVLRQKRSVLEALDEDPDDDSDEDEMDIEQLRQNSRNVPSLRWLQMVTWRHAIVFDIAVRLRIRGLQLTPNAITSAKRLWFMLDLSRSVHRIALMRDETYFSKSALEGLLQFLLRVDMAFTNPARKPVQDPTVPAQMGNTKIRTGCKLREFLLAERSLVPLWRVLRGWTWNPRRDAVPMTKLDVMHLYLRNDCRGPHLMVPGIMSLIGRTAHAFPNDIGVVGRERVCYRNPHTGGRMVVKGTRPLMGPDEILIGECLRRRIAIADLLLPTMLHGFVTPNGMKIPTPSEQFLYAMKTKPTLFLKAIAKTNLEQIKKNMEKKERDAAAEFLLTAGEESGQNGGEARNGGVETGEDDMHGLNAEHDDEE